MSCESLLTVAYQAGAPDAVPLLRVLIQKREQAPDNVQDICRNALVVAGGEAALLEGAAQKIAAILREAEARLGGR